MIRLTLLTLAGLVGAMVIWGNETASTDTSGIATQVLPAPESDIAESEPLAATTPDVTRRVTIDLTRLRPADDLQVFEAADAPAGVLIDSVKPVVRPVKASPDIAADDTRYLVVTGSRVNLRSGPSTSGDVIGRLERGAKAQFMAEAADGWVQIRDAESGRIGFMSGDFLAEIN